MSWLSPFPPRAPTRYPRRFPKTVVGSMVGRPNQVLNLPMHEGAGATVRDLSGCGNHGVLRGGILWVDGSHGWALRFNGTDTYVEIPHSAVLEPTDFALSLWVYPTAYGAMRAIVAKRTSAYNGYFIFYHTTTNTINWDWGGYPYRWDTGYLPPLNAWTHLAFVRDSTGRYLYVNGTLRSSTTDAGGSVASGSVLRIGADTYALQYFFSGIIAKVHMYSRALGSDEVRAIYEKEKALFA